MKTYITYPSFENHFVVVAPPLHKRWLGVLPQKVPSFSERSFEEAISAAAILFFDGKLMPLHRTSARSQKLRGASSKIKACDPVRKNFLLGTKHCESCILTLHNY